MPYHSESCSEPSSYQNYFFLHAGMVATALLCFFAPLSTVAAAEAAPVDRGPETVDTVDSTEDGSDTIVSEKDNVDLVKDSSIAEAVKRRPDLNFANVTIDGENSGVSLSSLSAEDVQSVEVMKAVNPDIDADSRGGSISLKTRPTYDQKKRVTALEGTWYYDSLDSAQGYRSRLSFSGPLNEGRTWGARASVSFLESPYAMETLYQDWQSENIDDNKEFVLRDTGYGIYERNIESVDLSLALDYKASDHLNFYWRVSSENDDYQTYYSILKYRFFRGDYTSVDDAGGTVEDADIRNSIWNYTTRGDESEMTLGGNYELDDLTIDFKYTVKNDEVEYLNYFQADFVQDDVDMRYDFSGDTRFPTTTLTDGKDIRDADSYEFENLSDRYFLGEETDNIGAINLKWDDPFDQRNMFIKMGYKTRTRENDRISENNIYDRYDGSFTVGSVLSDTSYPGILENRYDLDTIPDALGAESFFDTNIDNFTLNERRTRENSDPNTYVANESVDSYYGMLSMEFGKWRTILGIRNEATKVDFVGNEVILGENDSGAVVYRETNAVPGESAYDNFFPNAHFRYKWTDAITIIGSYTNTIDRPRYTYLVPYRRVNLEEQEIEEGNPNLKPTLFTNYDLSVDVEVSDDARLSVELFNRSVEDFVFSQQRIVQSGVYQGFELESFENSASADIQGATITWRQSLKGLAMLPDGLSLNANYTTQKSEIEYPARPEEVLPLTQTPDNELKLTLSYQHEKFFAQVRYAYEDLIPIRIAGDSNEDLYLLPNGQFDLSFTYQLKKNIRLFADVQNITSEPYYDRYEGESNRSAGYRYLPWTMSSGIRVEL
jgi:TonB-dependent receptor